MIAHPGMLFIQGNAEQVMVNELLNKFFTNMIFTANNFAEGWA